MDNQAEENTLQVVLATDCGSTTTKAVLFEKTAEGWRQTFRGEAPTTVEKPVADVTIGAKNAFRELEELSGRKLLSKDTSSSGSPILARTKENPQDGVDLYISTSSAGGGLQMIVAGVVSTMSAASAERAALGAGAIVMDVLSIDDGRETYQRIEKIRHLRPDIVLIAGGTNNGTKTHPLELSETILQADPRPRFGNTLELPVIYAANESVAKQAEEILSDDFAFVQVENIRPTLESENLAPARNEIHEVFLKHVMSHAPGYSKLLTWTPRAILPTPAAVGEMVLTASKVEDLEIVAVDIGGATSDVFSVFKSTKDKDAEMIFNRTVSANLGMSYSIANVMLEAGEENILRWLPFPLEPQELRDRLRNKMIRPTSIPQTVEDLILEQAVCREALRLSFAHHKRLAVGLKGQTKSRNIGKALYQQASDSLVDMMSLDLIIGSGGVLSHAPDRNGTAMILLDSYEPQGVTRLAVDSIFMMPHLGAFSEVDKAAATEVFFKDCLIPLGTTIVPIGKIFENAPILKVEISGLQAVTVIGGEIKLIELNESSAYQATLIPLNRSIDIGAGPGRALETQVYGGESGIIIDARGRPLMFNKDSRIRQRSTQKWFNAFGLDFK